MILYYRAQPLPEGTECATSANLRLPRYSYGLRPADISSVYIAILYYMSICAQNNAYATNIVYIRVTPLP